LFHHHHAEGMNPSSIAIYYSIPHFSEEEEEEA
jgi:hypothetical protein